MKTLDIAFKDLLRALRSAAFLAFGFFVPLLVSGIFYFAFGGLATDDGGFSLPTTRVQVVNQDQAEMGFSAGEILVQILASEELSDLVQVTPADDPAAARAAVDRQQAGVAMIVPAGFTAALFAPEGRASIELYQDPTLTLGPSIVGGIVQQFVDGFAGSRIAVDVAREQLDERGVDLDAARVQQVVSDYGQWAAALGESRQQGANGLLAARTPGGGGETPNLQTSIISLIMAGMMVFFVFFAGAATAQSLLQEEEEGTLLRLFTTPTPIWSVLGGRILASLVTLVLQVIVLLGVSALVFRIDWGRPLPLSLVTVGLVLLAASFGLFLTSLLKDTRQAGVVYGGVLTVLGMTGMIGIFTVGVPGAGGAAFETISLLTPHGWGVRGYELLLAGADMGDVAVPAAVMLGLAAAFFTLGLLRFRRRFA
jgi:ABC-2 type transport system permease protein